MDKNSRSLFILVLMVAIVGVFLYMNNQKENDITRAVLKVCRRTAELHAIYPDSDYLGDKMNDAELFGEPPFTLNEREKHFNGRCVNAARIMNLIE